MRWLFIACIGLALWGCGKTAPSKSQQQESRIAARQAAEQKLFSDPNNAASELMKRINADLKLRDGVLVVEYPLLIDLMVLSPNSPWVVSCGVGGINVVFGNLVSGDSNGISNDITIDLTFARIKKAECETLAPLIGNRIRAIAAGAP